MPRRKIVDSRECIICAVAKTDTSNAFAKGYIAGRHATAHGEQANEKVCTLHAEQLSLELSNHIKKGIFHSKK